MHWTTIRRWREQAQQTRVACKFTQPEALTQLLNQNGLAILAQYDHWDCHPFTATGPLIITLCQHAK